MADYGAGLWDLAIDGFEAYIRQFPKSDFADNAQVYICNSYLQQNKNEQAVEACDRAIRNYPGGDAVPQAYWYKGLAQNNLKDTTAARATWEELMTKFPDSSAALMAKQRLEQLKRP
jgi:TolA-binding protein